MILILWKTNIGCLSIVTMHYLIIIRLKGGSGTYQHYLQTNVLCWYVYIYIRAYKVIWTVDLNFLFTQLID